MGGRLPALPSLQPPRWGLLSPLPLGSVEPAPSAATLRHLAARDLGLPYGEAERQAGEKPLGKYCGSGLPCIQEAAGSSHPSWVFYAPAKRSHPPGSPLPQPTPGTKPLVLKHVRWIQQGKRGRNTCGSKALSILLDLSVSSHPERQPEEGVSMAGSRGYPLSFPITPILCTAPSGAKGEGAVGQDEPFLLRKARQPAALGL